MSRQPISVCIAVQYASQILNLLARLRSLRLPEEHIADLGDVCVAVKIYRPQASQSSYILKSVRCYTRLRAASMFD
jgi:hypothetical protein